jgi:hypothetical protein
MISVFVSSAKGCGFEPRPGQIKDYKIGICFFSVKDAELIRQSKDWLVRNQDNVSEWINMSTRGLLFLWTNIHTMRVSLVQNRHHLSKINLFLPWYR